MYLPPSEEESTIQYMMNKYLSPPLQLNMLSFTPSYLITEWWARARYFRNCRVYRRCSMLPMHLFRQTVLIFLPPILSLSPLCIQFVYIIRTSKLCTFLNKKRIITGGPPCTVMTINNHCILYFARGRVGKIAICNW